MKTKEQIDAEIAALRSMQPNVRHYSAFGDDNRAAIGAQVEVLEKRMDLDQVHAQFDRSDVRENVLTDAITACDWMEGRLADDAPMSEDWASLVTPSKGNFDPYSGR
ncbi:MAG: hypothetical protein HYX47_10420 [Burkholderiales bacterium]|nr:hypothetical protein [Burkholderiales bacterium]